MADDFANEEYCDIVFQAFFKVSATTKYKFSSVFVYSEWYTLYMHIYFHMTTGSCLTIMLWYAIYAKNRIKG